MAKHISVKRELLLTVTAAVAGLSASVAGAQTQPATQSTPAVKVANVATNSNSTTPPQVAKPQHATQNTAPGANAAATPATQSATTSNAKPTPKRGGSTTTLTDKFP